MANLDFTSVASSGLPEKLKIARRAADLTTREVEAKVSGSSPVSHATIANYEKGKSQPTLQLLSALAVIYGRPLAWFLEPGPLLTGIRYRSQKSKIRVGDRQSFEAQANRWLDAYLRIEKHLGQPLERRANVSDEERALRPSVLAARVRQLLGIGANDPIPSVVDTLEAFGIRVMELPTELHIDGMAAMLGSQPTVVLNPSCSNDRQRINGSHELFHVVLGHCTASPVIAGSDEDKGDEDLAYACARHFLIPEDRLKEAFAGESFVKLLKYKEMFGISLSALIYAARQERIMTDAKARHLWIELSKRGWRVKEPGHVREDRATRFEQLIDGAVTTGKLTWGQAAEVAAVREDELRDRVRLAMGITEPIPPRVEEDQEGEGGEPTFKGLRLAK